MKPDKQVLDWLLENENPSVRYFTLKEIMNIPESDNDVLETKNRIMETNPVLKILSTEESGGYWGKSENFYVYSKYKGTTFTFLLLAELGADGNNEGIRKTSEFLFDHSFEKKTGGFSFCCNEHGEALENNEGPCLTGKMVWALIKFGYLNDQRVQKAINWLTKYARCDDAIDKAPEGYPYCNKSNKPKNCWGRHTCYRNVFYRFKALSVIPPGQRTGEVKTAIENAVEFILKHHVYKRSHNLNEMIKDRWLQFIFPCVGEIDILQVLEILTSMGYKDRRMNDAIDYVLSRKNEAGRWILDKTLNGRIRARFESEGMESKWITYKAVKTLKKWDDLKY